PGRGREIFGEARGNEILDQRRDAQALPLWPFLGAELKLPVAFAGAEARLTNEHTALVQMLEIDREVWNLQQSLHSVLAERHLRILDTKAREVGGVATTSALEHIPDGARHVELAARPGRRRQLCVFGSDAFGASLGLSRRSRGSALDELLNVAARR